MVKKIGDSFLENTQSKEDKEEKENKGLSRSSELSFSQRMMII